eukprot:CAMPEP_0194755964 /NCGR_PEP_ID=MMETSP0323_2-20130528/9742_1 /TAXON_ID=2866 ORGANISM="Crypthecodinium cohnii, Strain Seligo" /NCGR_SAMPLE_ID=MMETSP0323_2 /ASSEMBLY_ACC=CAM_ASM_000346 /LENGTH=72 /DNA_ID=CAMNT_0039675265 /DNA_START=164 /DNA_END=382 /DNA_ORIENTATION=+
MSQEAEEEGDKSSQCVLAFFLEPAQSKNAEESLIPQNVCLPRNVGVILGRCTRDSPSKARKAGHEGQQMSQV